VVSPAAFVIGLFAPRNGVRDLGDWKRVDLTIQVDTPFSAVVTSLYVAFNVQHPTLKSTSYRLSRIELPKTNPTYWR
jgi:hypothetical protein